MTLMEKLRRKEDQLFHLYGTFNELTDQKMVDDTLEEIAVVQALMLAEHDGFYRPDFADDRLSRLRERKQE